MNYFHSFIIVLLICCLPSKVHAQALDSLSNTGATSQSIFHILAIVENGSGRVTVQQPQYVREMVGSRPASLMGAPTNGEKDPLVMGQKIAGYRVQIFSGNQSNSRRIATSREQEILELYPTLPTYVNYQAPFWKLRVGNFIHRKEAEAAMLQLKEEFPHLAKEMYVVRDAVYIF